MEEKDFSQLIEQIGELLSNLINDSEEIKKLMDEIKEMGHLPAISIEARLTLYDEVDEDEELFEETQVLLQPANTDTEFEEMITSEDKKFLKSINIEME